MQLHTYLNSLPNPDEKKRFASRCGTSLAYLKQVASGHRTCGESLAIDIDRESGGAVPLEVIRPDVDWAYVKEKPANSPAAM